MPGHGYLVGHPLEASLDQNEENDEYLITPPSTARIGASITFLRGRVDLAVPRGFLRTWHRGEIPEHPWRRGTPAAGEIARLARALSVANDTERVAAAEELRRCGKTAAPAIKAVIEAVGDPLPAVRWRAVEILRLIGPPDRSLPVLLDALREDPCRSVRWRVTEALGAATLPALPAARALIGAAQDADEWVRWHADRVLAQELNWSLVESLLPEYATSSSSPAIKAYAIGLLVKAARIDASLLLRLIEDLRHPAVAVRLSLIRLLNHHHPPPTRAIRRALRFCLEDFHPAVRAGAVRIIGRFADRQSVTLVQSAFADGSPLVRSGVCQALAEVDDKSSTRRRWLRNALGDRHLPVRFASVQALIHLGEVDRDVVAVLIDAVAQPARSLEAWQTLLKVETSREGAIYQAATALKASFLARLVAEDVAAGRLPTIGLRLWPENARIRYPNKEGGDRPPCALGYPWANAGVFHSWENHLPPQRSRIPGIIKQVSIAAPPFPNAHLIAAVEFARRLPHPFDGRSAPVRLEGRPIGSILEGTIGGAGASKPQPRMDFIFAVDLRFCQYATFAALSDQLSVTGGSLQAQASAKWRDFVSHTSALLDSHGLAGFCREHWFVDKGWQSSRYGLRRERPYMEICPGVAEFLAVLRSPRGKQLAAELMDVADSLVEHLERKLWREKLSSYPLTVRRRLASIMRESAANDSWSPGSWRMQLLEEA